MEFWIFGVLSLCVAVASVIYVAGGAAHRVQKHRMLSPLNLLTIGVFLAVVLMFIPIYYHWNAWSDDYAYIRPAILSVVGALRVFVLDMDFSLVEETVPTDCALPKVLFSLYAAVLYFAAPVLTFTNVLSLFRNLSGLFRLRSCRRRPVYIMSKLNEKSVSMAESIGAAAGKKGKPLIVFADVFARHEEDDYELMLRARSLDAILLKKDAAHIDFGRKGKPVEIFLLGDNEAENTSQAIRLAARWKSNTRGVSVYVFSSAPSTDCILDSLNLKDSLLHPQFAKWLQEHPKQFLLEDHWENMPPMSGNFSIRRIDPVDLLVMDVLTGNEYRDYKTIQQEAQKDKTVSVTILGMGRYGTHFLKTAVWFYQRYGYRVEFNIFDTGKENGDPEKRIRQECPELISKNRCADADDARYDIRFFTGTDCFSSDFDDLLLRRETDRLLRTKLVFVSLGDDDRDIRAAMTVRMLFDQMYIENGRKAGELPLIYSVVYDDQKVSNLNFHEQDPAGGLRNHKGKPYHIRFVGARADQYSYAVIRRNKEREAAAFAHHLDWTRKESQLRECYSVTPENGREEDRLAFVAALEQEQALLGKTTIEWGDGSYYQDETGAVNYAGPVNTAKVKETVEKYLRYAYYRQASVTRYDHKQALEQIGVQSRSHCAICGCKVCEEKRITEHMRWNAHVRSMGYRRYEDVRDERAKLHPDLRPWSELPVRERYKD